MKNVILLLLVFTFTIVNGCKEKEQSGYNCNNGNCTPVFENPQYLTLSDCHNACANKGEVAITASWNTWYVNCQQAYTVVIGLGYSSTDVANETYFAQSGSTLYSPSNYTVSNLAPGTYYYKAKKTYRSNYCAPSNGPPPPVVTKTGAFTITALRLTNVDVGSLD
ncbi:MAG: hypothetical protein FJ350_00345 [Sphingomonadales bacterium]|nr:hypothetical protein [Sphingomonadales bacterium]